MGIMVRDYDLVRHATMRMLGSTDATQEVHDRQHSSARPSPVDGFRPDALHMAGPAPLPNSIEDAFFTGFNTTNSVTINRPFNGQGDFFEFKSWHSPPSLNRLQTATPEEWESWNRQQRFADPEFPADEPFGIANFPKLPAYRMDTGELIDPLVVKPNPVQEAADVRIRHMLHRVADAALNR